MKTLENLRSIARIRSGKDQQRGFTLIELVVVLAVLGVLAAIAIPQLTNLTQDAELQGAATAAASEAGQAFAESQINGDGDFEIATADIDDLCNELGTDVEEEAPQIQTATNFTVDSNSSDTEPAAEFAFPYIDTADDNIIKSGTCYVRPQGV